MVKEDVLPNMEFKLQLSKLAWNNKKKGTVKTDHLAVVSLFMAVLLKSS